MKTRAQKLKTGILLTLITGLLVHEKLANAALKAPDFVVQTTPSNGKVNVQASAPAGHHFNTDAPMSLELESSHSRIKPTKSAPAQVVFEIPSAAKDSAKVALFLCDDAKSFCERHLVSVSWEGKAGAKKSAPQTSSHGAQKTSDSRPAIDEHGFYDNRPKEAFAKARASGKPLMIDFYGIWCPPCNELSDRVFSKPEFKKNAAAFVQLKMDADAPATEALFQRYGVQGFPTVIFASSLGDEISRVVGYRPIDQFLASMKNALTNPGQTFVALQVKAKRGDRAASDQVGLIYLDRGEYERAYHFLKDTQQEREKMLAAQIGLYELKAKKGDEKAKRQHVETIQKTIQEFPDSPDSVARREELASHFDEVKKPEDAKKVREDLISASKRILAKPELLHGYDFTDSDLYSSMAEAYAELGDKTQSATAWTAAAEIIQKKIDAGAERGGALDLAYCLRKLGKIEEATKLYQKMQKAYPGEFTFWLADAKMNMQLKNFDRARELAQKAFMNSYGANRLDSAVVLANAWKSLGKPEQSKKTIEQALESMPPLPPTTNPAARSRIRARIETLKKIAAEVGKSSG